MTKQKSSHSFTFEVLAHRKSQALKFAQVRMVRAQMRDLNIEPGNIKVREGERIPETKLWSMLDHLNQMSTSWVKWASVSIKSKFRTQTPLDPQPPCAVETGQTWLGLMFFKNGLSIHKNCIKLSENCWVSAVSLGLLHCGSHTWPHGSGPGISHSGFLPLPLCQSISIYVIWRFPEMGVPLNHPCL